MEKNRKKWIALCTGVVVLTSVGAGVGAGFGISSAETKTPAHSVQQGVLETSAAFDKAPTLFNEWTKKEQLEKVLTQQAPFTEWEITKNANLKDFDASVAYLRDARIKYVIKGGDKTSVHYINAVRVLDLAESNRPIVVKVEAIQRRVSLLTGALVSNKPTSEIGRLTKELRDEIEGVDLTDRRVVAAIASAQTILTTNITPIVGVIKNQIVEKHATVTGLVDDEGTPLATTTKFQLASAAQALQDSITAYEQLSTTTPAEVQSAKDTIKKIVGDGLNVWELIRLTHILRLKTEIANVDYTREVYREKPAIDAMIAARHPVKRYLDELRGKTYSSEDLKKFTPFVQNAIKEADTAYDRSIGAQLGNRYLKQLRAIVASNSAINRRSYRDENPITNAAEVKRMTDILFQLQLNRYLLLAAQGSLVASNGGADRIMYMVLDWSERLREKINGYVASSIVDQKGKITGYPEKYDDIVLAINNSVGDRVYNYVRDNSHLTSRKV